MNNKGIKKAAESNLVSSVSLKELVSAGVFEGKPVTVRQVATLTGGDVKMTGLALELQAEKGMLARFKIGSIEYYAAPAVALGGKGPSPIRIIKDEFREFVSSFKSTSVKKAH
jgi:hypothetical protein